MNLCVFSMIKTILLSVIFLFSYSLSYTHEYLVFFKDKPTISIQELKKSFSSKSLKNKTNIGFDYYDVPIHNNYLRGLAMNGIILTKSKWLNAVHYKTEMSPEELKNQFDFIVNIISLTPRNNGPKFISSANLSQDLSDTLLYDKSYEQVEMTHTISCLHDKNFTGSGVLIAVLDAGFPNMDSMMAFSRMRNEGRVIDTWDFEDNASFVYHKSTHGTFVSSIVGAELDSSFIGSAPKADYAFYITEIARFERNIEEFNLVLGLERADSIGADICSISLGYRNFDTLQVSYGYTGMDGKTTIAAQGVTVARNKGIIISVAAGNNGSGAGTLSSPCDADSILCVGAIRRDSLRAGFSSEGPTFDGRTKPEVVTVGEGCAFIRLDDSVRWGNGTSFSTPLMSGMVACIKQAHPLRTNFQIIEAIKNNSHLSSLPDNVYGWGIPDACKIDSALSYLDSLILTVNSQPKELEVSLFPNPSTGFISLKTTALIKQITILQIDGKTLSTKTIRSNNLIHSFDLSDYPKGVYLVYIESIDGRKISKKLIKQ